MRTDEPFTDEQARALLQAAADTVEVEPIAAPFTPSPASRRWPLLAAAAAVVVALGTAYAVVPLLGTDGPPAGPRPPTGPTPWDSVTLRDDQVPSVFGYSGEDARRLLMARGYDVTTQRTITVADCQDVGRAVRTTPAVGSLAAPGDPVTLYIGDSQAICTGQGRVWRFVDFANGRAKAPTVMQSVEFTVNGTRTVLLGRQARDPANWPACPAELSTCPGSAAAVVAAAAARVRELRWSSGQRSGVRYDQPTLQADSTGLTDRFTIDFPSDGVFFPQWHVTLRWGATWGGDDPYALAGVDLVWQESPAAAISQVAVPALIGMPSSQAARALVDLGFAVTREQEAVAGDACVTGPYVLDQRPAAGKQVPAGTRVTLRERVIPCGEDLADPSGVGHDFVSFARGSGPPPAYADTVRLYLGSEYVRTASGADLADPAAWDLEVTTYAEGSPPFNAVDVLSRTTRVLFASAAHEGTFCPDGRDGGPQDTGGTHVVALSNALSRSCLETFEVQLWLDDADEIVAVNLLLGSP